VVTHLVVHLAGNPLLRAALRVASRRRGENPEGACPAAADNTPLGVETVADAP
jgi:hypothetical protein